MQAGVKGFCKYLMLSLLHHETKPAPTANFTAIPGQ